MEYDIGEDLDGMESLITKKEKVQTKCKGKYIILIVIGNLILIALCILVIHLVSETKVNKISKLFNDYLIEINKIAITANRIKHLVKTDTKDKYQTLVDLEKLILNNTRVNFIKNKEAIDAFDDLISKFLFPNDNQIYNGIAENLTKILTQEEDYKIYQLLDTEQLKILNEKLNNEENNNEKILLENKLKAVILYGLINFPMQITYFSKNKSIKQELINSTIEKLNPDKILNKINEKMEKYDNNTYNLYMALGSGQLEERKRMTTKVKNLTYINFMNTGLRIESTNDEIEKCFKDSFENYYINETYKELMMACSADEMTEKKYNDFIEGCRNLISDKYTKDNMKKINEFFNEYTFSVETANTVVEYLKLNVSLEKIHIIRLGYKYRHKLLNEPLKYDENDVYILYNVFDISPSSDNMKRATTEANIKAIYYLKDECPNFLKEDDYDKFILVSSLGAAERQLEAFNIISNINNYNIKFDAVIWNDENTKPIYGKDAITYILDIFVKSTNLISTSLFKVNNSTDEIKSFIEKALNLTEKYK